jgi:NAD(P)-dependent dehydrogenase (short-subunit alcohol dehydrogenase family)
MNSGVVAEEGLEYVAHRPASTSARANASTIGSASKAAVHMLTRHLAKRLARENITVNAIAPGPFESKMMAFMLRDEQSRQAVEQMVPLGRIGRPDDAAGLTIFLCSRAGAYLTGAVIPLDGGITGCN